MTAVRARTEAFAVQENVTIALPLPLFGLAVSQDALLVALHDAPGAMVNANVLLPADGAWVETFGDTLAAALAFSRTSRSTAKRVKFALPATAHYTV